MPIVDITLTLRDGLPGWPWDTPLSVRPRLVEGRGATVNVGRISTSVHIGTHVDAPYHFDDSGPAIDA